MTENEFYALVMKLVALMVSVLIVSTASCAAYSNHLIGTSKDPLATSCAINGQQASVACITVAKR